MTIQDGRLRSAVGSGLLDDLSHSEASDGAGRWVVWVAASEHADTYVYVCVAGARVRHRAFWPPPSPIPPCGVT